jgi:hypothetical protein
MKKIMAKEARILFTGYGYSLFTNEAGSRQEWIRQEYCKWVHCKYCFFLFVLREGEKINIQPIFVSLSLSLSQYCNYLDSTYLKQVELNWSHFHSKFFIISFEYTCFPFQKT